MGLAAILAIYVYQNGLGKASARGGAILLSYWSQLQQPLHNLVYSYKNIHNSFIDVEKVLKLLKKKPSVEDKKDASALIIEEGKINFNKVDFSYDIHGTALTLTDVTFSANPGEMVALVGRSGAGKSTILRLVYRLYDIENGVISIDGQNIRDVTLQSLRSVIGIVPQVKIIVITI